MESLVGPRTRRSWRCTLRTDYGQDLEVCLTLAGFASKGLTHSPPPSPFRSGPFGAIADKKRAKKLGAAKAAHNQDEGMKDEKTHDEEKGGKGKGGKKGTGLGKGERYLLHDFSGVVKAGEMMLVVVRLCSPSVASFWTRTLIISFS